MTTDDRRVAEALAEIERLKAERDTWQLSCRNAERARDEAIAHRDKAEAERDLYYNRVASLLYSDELRNCKTDYIRKLATEYTDARAERDALRALLRAAHRHCPAPLQADIAALLNAARKEGEG